VDLSGLIFVALAVAWAVYLIPKALRHHEDVVRSRSVEKFSDSMRVLARREPVDKRRARLVVTPGRPARRVEMAVHGEPTVTSEEEILARRVASNRAARRRRRVLLLLLLANLAVIAVATAHAISWAWVAGPALLLAAWLVACRVMVRHERAWTPATVAAAVVDALEAEAAETAEHPALDLGTDTDADADTDTGSIAVVDPALWDPVPVTLPTYVGKPAAQRTVSTIDLDATGVWTSGRNEADSLLAREAEKTVQERADRAAGVGT
jgi:hypothetical protein